MIALVIGGSGSGKSAYAEGLIDALPRENRVYIATMQAMDAEARARVARHRAQRSALGFHTVECPMDLGRAPVPPGATALLEDLPNLLANEMFDDGDSARIEHDLRALAGRCANLVVVTGDVFSDGAAWDGAMLEYLRRLAALNAAVAALADSVVEVVYSIPVVLKGGDAPWA